jgi:hypothetical protein
MHSAFPPGVVRDLPITSVKGLAGEKNEGADVLQCSA